MADSEIMDQTNYKNETELKSPGHHLLAQFPYLLNREYGKELLWRVNDNLHLQQVPNKSYPSEY